MDNLKKEQILDDLLEVRDRLDHQCRKIEDIGHVIVTVTEGVRNIQLENSRYATSCFRVLEKLMLSLEDAEKEILAIIENVYNQIRSEDDSLINQKADD